MKMYSELLYQTRMYSGQKKFVPMHASFKKVLVAFKTVVQVITVGYINLIWLLN